MSYHYDKNGERETDNTPTSLGVNIRNEKLPFHREAAQEMRIEHLVEIGVEGSGRYPGQQTCVPELFRFNVLAKNRHEWRKYSQEYWNLVEAKSEVDTVDPE